MIGKRGRRPQDDRALEMWAAYQAGKSLRAVAEIFDVTRTSVLGMFQRRGWKCRPKSMSKHASRAVRP